VCSSDLDLFNAMFNGRSPNPKDLPAGLNFHPLGKVMGTAIFWADVETNIKRTSAVVKNCLIMLWFCCARLLF
jgi:hypothetical protein